MIDNILVFTPLGYEFFIQITTHTQIFILKNSIILHKLFLTFCPFRYTLIMLLAIKYMLSTMRFINKLILNITFPNLCWQTFRQFLYFSVGMWSGGCSEFLAIHMFVYLFHIFSWDKIIEVEFWVAEILILYILWLSDIWIYIPLWLFQYTQLLCVILDYVK